MFKKEEELWVTNMSLKKDVVIGDLNIVVRKGSSINLLAKKKNGLSKYLATREQIDRSIENGCIFKNDNLRIRKVAPAIFNHRIDIVEEVSKNVTKFTRKATEIEIPDFPDLDFEDGSDEEFAAKQADMEFDDRKPLLAVDPKFNIKE